MTPSEEAQIARGVRGRQIRRLIPVADRRATRRFRAWLNGPAYYAPGTRLHRLYILYIEAEDLHENLVRLNISQGVNR